MSTTKVKIYKNPERNKSVVHKPYIPQYQVMGVEPAAYKSPLYPNNAKLPRPVQDSTDNPRAPRAYIRQPYAEAISSPIGRGKGPIPNVGNNMEQTWSGVDGEIVDDIFESLDPNHTMVDNNDFVSAKAMGLADNEHQKLPPNTEEPVKNFLTEDILQNALKEEYLSKIIKQLEEEEYCILIDGEAVCSGSFDYIQEQTKALIFGEHELCNDNSISIDDILIIKRVKIKVGVFLD